MLKNLSSSLYIVRRVTLKQTTPPRRMPLVRNLSIHARLSGGQGERSVAIDTQINSKLHNAEKQWSRRLDAIRGSAEVRREELINWK